MRHVVFWAAFILALLVMPHSADAVECPEGYFCLTGEQAAEIADILEHHNCMVDAAEEGRIQLTLEPDQIVVTHDGQVFVQDEIMGELKWCSWELGLRADAEVIVHFQEPDIQTWGFRLRFRLGAGLLVPRIGSGDRLIEPLLLFEPFFVRDFHALVFGGLTHFGVGAGIDLTRNLNAFGGVGLGYRDADIAPILGISLSFN